MYHFIFLHIFKKLFLDLSWVREVYLCTVLFSTSVVVFSLTAFRCYVTGPHRGICKTLPRVTHCSSLRIVITQLEPSVDGLKGELTLGFWYWQWCFFLAPGLFLC